MTGSKKQGRFIFSPSLVAKVVLPAPIMPEMEMKRSLLFRWSRVSRLFLFCMLIGASSWSVTIILTSSAETNTSYVLTFAPKARLFPANLTTRMRSKKVLLLYKKINTVKSLIPKKILSHFFISSIPQLVPSLPPPPLNSTPIHPCKIIVKEGGVKQHCSNKRRLFKITQ